MQPVNKNISHVRNSKPTNQPANKKTNTKQQHQKDLARGRLIWFLSESVYILNNLYIIY